MGPLRLAVRLTRQTPRPSLAHWPQQEDWVRRLQRPSRFHLRRADPARPGPLPRPVEGSGYGGEGEEKAEPEVTFSVDRVSRLMEGRPRNSDTLPAVAVILNRHSASRPSFPPNLRGRKFPVDACHFCNNFHQYSWGEADFERRTRFDSYDASQKAWRLGEFR